MNGSSRLIRKTSSNSTFYSYKDEIFHYTRCDTPKRVTSWQGQSPRHCAGNTAPFEEMSQRWRVVGNTVSNFTDPRFEPQTSRSKANTLPLDQLAGAHFLSRFRNL